MSGLRVIHDLSENADMRNRVRSREETHQMTEETK